jgi:hypothetical protein
MRTWRGLETKARRCRADVERPRDEGVVMLCGYVNRECRADVLPWAGMMIGAAEYYTRNSEFWI